MHFNLLKRDMDAYVVEEDLNGGETIHSNFVSRASSIKRSKIKHLLAAVSVFAILGFIISTVCIVMLVQQNTSKKKDCDFHEIIPELEEKSSSDFSTFNLDVVFLLDGSMSITPTDFDAMKEFVKDVSLRIGLGQDDVHVGVVQYSYYYADQENQPYMQTQIRLGEFSSFESFTTAVDGIIQHGYTTHTGQALKKVQYDFRNSINFGNNNAMQILILLTDGNATDSHIVPEAAEQLRSLGVIPFAIGIGGFKTNDLRIIATGNSSSSERVFEAGNYDQLMGIAVKIEAEIRSLIASREITTKAPVVETTATAG